MNDSTVSEGVIQVALDAHNEAYGRNELPMWAVYEHPDDDPGKYVARLRVIGPGMSEATGTALRSDKLEDLRTIFTDVMGLVRLERDTVDDPAVMELWL